MDNKTFNLEDPNELYNVRVHNQRAIENPKTWLVLTQHENYQSYNYCN